MARKDRIFDASVTFPVKLEVCCLSMCESIDATSLTNSSLQLLTTSEFARR